VWTVDIDVGGTLTDGICAQGGQTVCVKVDSTPHDLTVCLFDALTQAASQLGFEGAREFLENVELIRWSTTITSNVLAEGRGPRIGLLVSSGHEEDLYGPQERSPVLGRLLGEREVVGITDGSGIEAAEEEVMNAARFLLERGARRICVSLKGAEHDPVRELRVKRIIDEQYPDHYLGSVPVLAGSDISKSADAATRTACALINAYTHGALAATLFKAEDELRGSYGYRGVFLVCHTSGGVAGVGKTKAIDTIESGPILGLHGSRFLAGNYGLGEVIALDVGGTTAKVGVLRGGEAVLRQPSDFFGIPVGIALPYLRSIALGGGSVVKLRSATPRPGHAGRPIIPPGPEDAGERRILAVELGPESMGSFPGPACYALGGDQPTLTDAFVAAGLIDPEYFLGGTKPLDAELARRTMEECVARPLGVSLEDACRRVIDAGCESVARLIMEAQAELGLDLARHTLFAYGGNGGLLACGVAERAGLGRIQFFSHGPVFSAFGSSVSDIVHVYERRLPAGALSADGIPGLLRCVEEMKRESVQDLLGESISPEGVTYAIEIEVSAHGLPSMPVPVPEAALGNAPELHRALAAALPPQQAKNGLAGAPLGDSETKLDPELIRLRARKSMPKPEFSSVARVSRPGGPSSVQTEPAALPPQQAKSGLAGPAALESRATGPDDSRPGGRRYTSGTRRVFWGSRDGTARILRWDSFHPSKPKAGSPGTPGFHPSKPKAGSPGTPSLAPGSRVAGPAILEGAQTTYFIPEGWTISLDGWGNGQVRREAESAERDLSSTREAYGDAA
jgi:N-methylhydantoinase A/oxoprolinase/acetone carboxylase beta subunit